MTAELKAKYLSAARHFIITLGAVGAIAILQYAMKIDFGTYTPFVDAGLALVLRFVSTFVPTKATIAIPNVDPSAPGAGA